MDPNNDPCAVDRVNMERPKYRKIKQKVIKEETKNCDRIIAMSCVGKDAWKQIGGHSALIYYFAVAKQLGVKANFRKDDDFEEKYAHGLLKFRGLSTLRKRITQVGLFENEVTGSGVTVFRLNKKFTQKELDEFAEALVTERKEMGQIVQAKVLRPKLHQKLCQTTTTIHAMCKRRMDQFSRDTLGVEITNTANRLLMQYYFLTDVDKGKVVKEWEEMLATLDELMVKMQVANALGVWDVLRSARICTELVEMREMLENEIKQAKRNARAANKKS